jgi:hypothetical protein
MPALSLAIACAFALCVAANANPPGQPITAHASPTAARAVPGCPWYDPICDDDGVHRG